MEKTDDLVEIPETKDISLSILAEDLRRFVYPLLNRNDIILTNFRAPFNLLKEEESQLENECGISIECSCFDVIVCAFGKEQVSCKYFFKMLKKKITKLFFC